jgi:RNA polymerase sigma-70 factor (ECF subfamily)
MQKKLYREEDALRALIKGQERGLDYFFKLYYSPLTFFAFKLLEDQFKAEETAAEAFIKLWNHRERLSEEGSIKAWLYSTVRNACLDELRKVKRMAVNEEGLRFIQPHSEAPVLQRMIESETLSQIIHTLENLPPKCSQVFQLFYLQGKTHEEIASELNISPHTVRNQKLRAIRLIRGKMLLLWLLLFSLFT